VSEREEIEKNQRKSALKLTFPKDKRAIGE
jgi:hypothetical protein